MPDPAAYRPQLRRTHRSLRRRLGPLRAVGYKRRDDLETGRVGRRNMGEPVLSDMSNWRMSGIVVREARPGDLDAIAMLENESFESDRVSRRSLQRIPASETSSSDRCDHRRRNSRVRAGRGA